MKYLIEEAWGNSLKKDSFDYYRAGRIPAINLLLNQGARIHKEDINILWFKSLESNDGEFADLFDRAMAEYRLREEAQGTFALPSEPQIQSLAKRINV